MPLGRSGRISYGAHGNFCWAIAGSVQIIHLMRESNLETMEQERPSYYQMISSLVENHPVEPLQVNKH